MSRWGILAVLFAARAVMGFQFQSIASISNFLLPDLDIEYAEIGTLIGLYLLPGVVIAYPGGALGKKFGDKRIVLVGLSMMALGGFVIGVADNYTLAVLGRVVCGTGAVLLNVLLTKMLLDWFSGREVIAAMAILVNSWPFGIAAGLVSQGWIAENLSWPMVQHIAAVMSVAALMMMALFYSSPHVASTGSAKSLPSVRLSTREVTLVSLSGIIWCFYNVGLIVVISFSAATLQLGGMALTEASVLVSVGTWLGIATLPLGGLIAQRFQMPNTVMISCFVLSALVIVWIPDGAWPLVTFILFGVFAWSPAGPIMALPGDVLHPENRGPGMGIFFTWYYVGMGVLPTVAGLTYDLTGNSAAPLYFAAMMMMACVPLLGVFRVLASRMATHPIVAVD